MTTIVQSLDEGDRRTNPVVAILYRIYSVNNFSAARHSDSDPIRRKDLSQRR